MNANPLPTHSQLTRVLLWCGAVAGPLFILVFLLEGATRADYNPLRHPISDLSIGALGWMQSANFILTGLLYLAFAFGLRRAMQPGGGAFWGPLLVGFGAGLGLLGAGFFATDPLAGYPPGTPLIPTQTTTAGLLHNIFSAFLFLGLPFACFVFTYQFIRRGARGWAIYSALSGIGLFAFFVLAGLGFRQSPGYAELGGLYQRISVAIALLWLTLVAVYFLRKTN